jgi:hypothetical protein
VDGQLTSSPLEVPPHHHYWGNFAIDDAARAGAPVYARFSKPSGRLSLSVKSTFDPCLVANSAGSGVIVDVSVDGKKIGSVHYGHLTEISKTHGTIKNGAKLGRLWSGEISPCWNGPHVHVEPKSASGAACFVKKSLYAAAKSGAALGVLGPNQASVDNQACRPGASTPETTHPSKPNDPIGHVDLLKSPQPGQLRVAGWAFDQSAPTKSVEIHVYVGGKSKGPGVQSFVLGSTDKSRPDVQRDYSAANANATAGFDGVLTDIRAGKRRVYVYAINVGKGSNVLLGSKTVKIKKSKKGSANTGSGESDSTTKTTGAPTSPIGFLDSASSPGVGQVRIQGWAFDPNAPTAPVQIQAYVGGEAGSGAKGFDLGVTSIKRSGVQKNYPGAGPTTGFDFTLMGAPTGSQRVYVYALDIGAGGSNALIGKQTVTIQGASIPPTTPVTAPKPTVPTTAPHPVNVKPIGFLDVANSPGPGQFHIEGWAFDWDAPFSPVTIHVYVGGEAGSGAPGFDLGATSVPRSGVQQNYPGVGPNTGFNFTHGGAPSGVQTLYVYAINVPSGPPLLITKKTITIL